MTGINILIEKNTDGHRLTQCHLLQSTDSSHQICPSVKCLLSTSVASVYTRITVYSLLSHRGVDFLPSLVVSFPILPFLHYLPPFISPTCLSLFPFPLISILPSLIPFPHNHNPARGSGSAVSPPPSGAQSGVLAAGLHVF